MTEENEGNQGSAETRNLLASDYFVSFVASCKTILPFVLPQKETVTAHKT